MEHSTDSDTTILKSEKTWKREVAVALLVWFAYVVETKDVAMVQAIVYPLFAYSALAFGIDWYGKTEFKKGGRG